MFSPVRLTLLIVVSCLSILGIACKPDKDLEEVFGPPTPKAMATPARWPNPPPMPADNPLTEEGVALGRRLFYDKQLSINNSISCSSCHQPDKAFTDGRARALGMNGQQHQRGSMALVNLAWASDFAWDGATTQLEIQARTPLESPIEMHQSLAASASKLQQIALYPRLFGQAFGSSTVTGENILKALAQFERTLVSANSKYDKVLRGETLLSSDEQRGLQLMGHSTGGSIRGAECLHCHTAPLFTGPKQTFFNNGLDVGPFADPGRGAITGQNIDMGAFKAPTLRNIALTAPYMHDGRFQTLQEVLDHYSDHIQLTSPNLDPQLANSPNSVTGRILLTQVEKQRIIAFLQTLTDSSFINNPKLVDPGP